MGSRLGPALTNIFVGYCDEKLFSQTQRPPAYFRYVDNTFAIFDHEAEANEYLNKLNCLHSSLRFTFEKERERYVYRFLTFTSKEQMLTLRPVYTENPLLPASICVGSPLVLSNVK